MSSSYRTNVRKRTGRQQPESATAPLATAPLATAPLATAPLATAPRRRPLPYHGPYLSIGGVAAVPFWDRHLGVYRFALVDAADYGMAMRRAPWNVDRNGYPCKNVFDVDTRRSLCVYLHRVIARAPAHSQVDHTRHRLFDCRRSQLRWATPSQNSANRRMLALVGRKSSQYRGVTRSTSTKSLRWQAAAHFGGRCHYLGLFKTEIEAAFAYDRKAIELWGRFAILNFPLSKAA